MYTKAVQGLRKQYKNGLSSGVCYALARGVQLESERKKDVELLVKATRLFFVATLLLEVEQELDKL